MEASVDRKRTAVEPGQSCTFKFLGLSFIPPFEQVTSVSVVPFTEDGRIVCALLERGIDLPGGHVKENESDCEQTAHRETKEEAGITIKNLSMCAVIESDYYGSEAEKLTYIVIYAATVASIDPFEPDLESFGREILDVPEFLARYSGNRVMMQKCLNAATNCHTNSAE